LPNEEIFEIRWPKSEIQTTGRAIPFGLRISQSTMSRNFFIVVLIAAGFAATAAEVKPPATVRDWTNSVPRVFLKDRHLRLYSGAESERVLFEAEWKKAPSGGAGIQL
jgi:hypothetical protein